MRIFHCVLISISLLVLAFAILLKDYSNPLNHLSSLQRPPSNVTSYVLALQWPQGVCTYETCWNYPVPRDFTIHGLWPDPNGTESNERYDRDKIENLTSQLDENWPDLLRKYNHWFWHNDQWDNHGKYSELGGLWNYFNKTLGLFNEFGQGKLVAKLAAEGIIPSNTATYNLSAIEAALNNINDGYNVTIRCCQRNDGTNRMQIKKILINYTNDFTKQDALQPSNCFINDSGDPEILFPAPPHHSNNQPESHHHPL